MSKKQIDIKKLVFRVDDDFYFCDYIFYHELHGKPFNGATFTLLTPIHKDIYEDMTSFDEVCCRYKEVWQQRVWDEGLEEGLEEWVEGTFFGDGSDDIDESVFDLSGYEYWDELRSRGYSEDEYPVFDCVGGGRSFRKNPDEIYDYDLWVKVCKAEGYIVGHK